MVKRRDIIVLASLALAIPAHGQDKVQFYVKNDGVAGEVTVWEVADDGSTKEVFKMDMEKFPNTPNEKLLDVPGPAPKKFKWQHKAGDKIRTGDPALYQEGEQIVVYSVD